MLSTHKIFSIDGSITARLACVFAPAAQRLLISGALAEAIDFQMIVIASSTT
jgi:hypothetical protein